MPVQFESDFEETERRHDRTDPLLDTNGAAAYAGLSSSTMNKKRLDGTGPSYYKIGRAVRYRQADIDAWLRNCQVQSTSEPAPLVAALDCHNKKKRLRIAATVPSEGGGA